MVFQNFALLPWRSVVENVALGLELSGLDHGARLEKARGVLGTVGLTDWAEKKVSELSGGMQQRVGLARAFATDAPILLMDEPFSALDPLIRTRLQDELLELQDKLRCTILFVSHDLEEAVKIGNTITIMEGGRIVQSGKPEDIVLRPADAYVTDFVAQLNPLSVLRATDVMQPLSGTGAPGGAQRQRRDAAARAAAALRRRCRAGAGGRGRQGDGRDHPGTGVPGAVAAGGVRRRRAGDSWRASLDNTVLSGGICRYR